MTNKVFIFNEVCPGGNYGIKTYIEQLSCSCFNMKNFEVHIVNLRSNVNEFTINHESDSRFGVNWMRECVPCTLTL